MLTGSTVAQSHYCLLLKIWEISYLTLMSTICRFRSLLNRVHRQVLQAWLRDIADDKAGADAMVFCKASLLYGNLNLVIHVADLATETILKASWNDPTSMDSC